MKYDIAVIGSGIAGLTAALLCALNNKKTAVFEKSKKTAPLLSRFKRNNVYCDPGFHYTGEFRNNLSILFKYMGIEIESCPLNPENFDTILTNGKEYRIPYGYDRLSSYLCSEFPDSKNTVKILLKKIESILLANPFTNFSSNNSNHELLSNMSLKEFLKKAGAENNLINLLGTHSYFFSGVEADEIPLSVYAHIMGSIYSSAYTLPRGGDTFVNVFKKRLKELEVPVYTDTGITKIISNNSKKITGLKTGNNTFIECKNCISTIHPQILINILPKDYVRPVFIKRIKKYKNTASPFVVFLDLDKIPCSLSNSNYLVNDKTISETKLGFLTPGNNIQEKACFTAINYCSKEISNSFFSGDYKNIKKTETNKIINCFENLFPNTAFKIIETATPKTYEKYTGTINGSIFGIKQSVNQHFTGIKGGLKGLYLAGQNLTPGIMGSIYSSLTAVMQIINPEIIWNGIRKYL